MTEQLCPRRAENPDPHGVFKFPKTDQWRTDGKCSYCGSVNPDELMRLLEAGEIELGPTDKNYKVYLSGEGHSHSKFYFQHLSKEQQARFIELLNEKKIKLGYPGRFYVLPFFIGIA